MTKRSFTSRAKRAVKNTVFAHFPFMLGHSCGFPAFYLKNLPIPEEIINPKNIMYPDGSMPKMGDTAVCFKCKQNLTHEDLDAENIRRVQ